MDVAASGYAVSLDSRRICVMDEARARQLLDERLRELDETNGEVRGQQAEFRDESGRLSQHPADYATDVEHVEEQNLVLGYNREEREQVLAAQRRLDAGTYGICVDCGRPIDDERLEARPQAERCSADQERAERRQR